MALALLAFSGCESSADPPSAEQAVGGMSGAPSVAVLESLQIEGLDCEVQEVSNMTCQFIPDGVHVDVGRKHEPDSVFTRLLSVLYADTVPGTGRTPDDGYVEVRQLDCFSGALSTLGQTEPCELELEEIERGAPATRPTESGGSIPFEAGSRVRLRVSCPGGIYSRGNEDIGPLYVSLVPQEFVLEAQDCMTISGEQ